MIRWNGSVLLLLSLILCLFWAFRHDSLHEGDFYSEWRDIDGTWRRTPDDEVNWFDDTLRWTAICRPTFGRPVIARIDFQCRPSDDPKAPWKTFATSVGNAPAVGNPGLGVWMIRFVATIEGQLSETSPSESSK